MDSLRVEVEASSNVDPENYSKIAESAKERIKSLVGISCEVEIKKPGEMPRTEGKSQRVLDLRNQTAGAGERK